MTFYKFTISITWLGEIYLILFSTLH